MSREVGEDGEEDFGEGGERAERSNDGEESWVGSVELSSTGTRVLC